MKKMSFRVQACVCVILIALGFVFGMLTKDGLFSNIAWLSCGILFLLNPVWPNILDRFDHKQLQLGCRVGGLLMIIFGMITRFGV